MTKRVRMTAVFRGRVQGVGFRYTACELAAAFPVSGSVENLADGTVRMAAEGRRDACEAFLEAMKLRMARFLRGTEVSWGHPEGEAPGFRILR